MRSAIEKLRKADVALNVVAAVLGIYAAAANVLRGAKAPDAGFWDPWGAPFSVLLAAVVFVPLFALYKYLVARYESEERLSAERERDRSRLDADMAIHCQQIAAALAHQCPQITLDQMAISIWLCEAKGRFDRRYRFFLPHDRKPSGIDWRKGVGVAGMAWKLNRDLATELSQVRRLRDELGEKRFDELPPDERWGMTYEDFGASNSYAGIIAMRLFPHVDPGDDPLGILVVDYSGDGSFDCLVDAVKKQPVAREIGAAARTLAQRGHERKAER